MMYCDDFAMNNSACIGARYRLNYKRTLDYYTQIIAIVCAL